MDSGTPISYMALQVGTPVQSSEGHRFGTVEHVLQDPELDLFDGIVIFTARGLRFVDRDQIGEITTGAVELHPHRCAGGGAATTRRAGRFPRSTCSRTSGRR